MHASGRQLSCLALFALALFFPCLSAAQQVSPSPQNSAAGASAQQPDDDDPVAAQSVSPDSAWTLLTTSAHNPKRPQIRIQALAALATLSANPRAIGLITDAMKDPDVDVRTAAILAAASTKNRTFLPAIHARLEDDEPQVVYTAATTLWKMHDRSGERILMAIADGDRKATPTLAHGARHDMSKDLHDPSALTRIGVTEGASMLLGPFGFGIAAMEYIRKNNGDSARAASIALLAEDKSAAVRTAFINALGDKDPAVRAAAATALGQRHEPSLGQPLGNLFTDSKLPVRLTAAAAYLNSTQPSTTHAPQHSAHETLHPQM